MKSLVSRARRSLWANVWRARALVRNDGGTSEEPELTHTSGRRIGAELLLQRQSIGVSTTDVSFELTRIEGGWRLACIIYARIHGAWRAARQA